MEAQLACLLPFFTVKVQLNALYLPLPWSISSPPSLSDVFFFIVASLLSVLLVYFFSIPAPCYSTIRSFFTTPSLIVLRE